MAVIPATNVPALIADKPCVQCLDEKQKLIFLVYLIAVANGRTLPDDVATLMTASKCDTCATDDQLMEALISKLWYTYANSTTAAQIMENSKCLQCVSDRKLREIIVRQLIVYIGAANPA